MRWSYTKKQMRKKEKQNTTFKDYILASKSFLVIIVSVQITFLAKHSNNIKILTITLIRKMDCSGRKKCHKMCTPSNYVFEIERR
jgi:uncharacterized membrane protein